MNRRFKLTTQQLLDLKNLERQVGNYQILRRVTALRMKHNGFNNTEVARALGVSRASVGRWIKAFQEDSLAGIARDNYKRRQAKLGLRQWLEIREACKQGEIKGSWVLKRYVEVNYGLHYNQEYLKHRAREKYGIKFRSLGAPTS